MKPLKLLETNTFFILIGIMLAFGMYQTLGTALETDTPVVSVVSDSMEPTFYRGDILIVKGTSLENIQASPDNGTIIVYETPYMPMPIIHRVIDKTDTTLETRGDNNDGQVTVCVQVNQIRKPDNGCGPGEERINIEKNITQSQVLGKALFIIPKLGYAKLLPTCYFYKLTLPDSHPSVQNTCRGL